MTTASHPPTASQADTLKSGRQIMFWGSAARFIVGSCMIIGAVLAGISALDALLGLVVFPLVEVLVLAVRGPKARPLRLYGVGGHGLNWGIGFLAFALAPVAALLFYGSSILLAFVRGYAGCEIFAISNWLRRRDDQIVCPIFSPIDHAEARRAGAAPSC